MTNPGLSGGRAMLEPDWCEKCHAHIIPMGLLELAWSWACWHLVMHWPYRFFANSAHLAILPWAGNIAYRCTCRRNNLRARAADTPSVKP